MLADVAKLVDEAARPDSHATMDANDRQPGQAPAQINFPPGLAPLGALLGDTFSAGTIQQSQPLRQGCVVVEEPTKFVTKIVRTKVVGRTRWNHDEEEKLKKLVEEHGAKGSWRKISELLGSGRSASAVEQHWQVMTGPTRRGSATPS